MKITPSRLHSQCALMTGIDDNKQSVLSEVVGSKRRGTSCYTLSACDRCSRHDYHQLIADRTQIVQIKQNLKTQSLCRITLRARHQQYTHGHLKRPHHLPTHCGLMGYVGHVEDAERSRKSQSGYSGLEHAMFLLHEKWNNYQSS